MSEPWDEFSKSLSEPVPRRESLRRLGSVFAGALFGSLGLKQAVAARKIDPCTAFCKCSYKKKKNACIAACPNCGSDPRWLCGNCSSGYVCSDLANDPDNCGGCGNACDWPDLYEEGACIDGNCMYECVPGATRCNGICTDLGGDRNNCGACGNVCPASAPYCNQGVCNNLMCPGGQTHCSGVCYDLYNDSNNCGVSCETRVVCGVYETCTGGMCIPVF